MQNGKKKVFIISNKSFYWLLYFFLFLFSNIALYSYDALDIPLEYEYQLDGIYYRYLVDGEIDVFLPQVPSVLIQREENYFLILAIARKAWKEKNYSIAAKIFPASVKFPCERINPSASKRNCIKIKKDLNQYHQKFVGDGRYLQYRKDHQIWKNLYMFYNDEYHLYAEDFGFHIVSKQPFFLHVLKTKYPDALIRIRFLSEHSQGNIYVVLNPKLHMHTLTDFENEVKKIHMSEDFSDFFERKKFFLYNQHKTISKEAIQMNSNSFRYIIWKTSSMGYIFKMPIDDDFKEISLYLLSVSDI